MKLFAQRTEQPDPAIERVSIILKADEERHLVYGIVMVADDDAITKWKTAGEPLDALPDVIDTQGEYVSEQTLEKAFEGFMARYARAMEIRGVPLVGEEHRKLVDGVVMMQSAMLPKGTRWPDAESEPLTAAKNWVVCDYIEDDDLWQQIKAGEITGYSIGGVSGHGA